LKDRYAILGGERSKCNRNYAKKHYEKSNEPVVLIKSDSISKLKRASKE
jgi:hypothetical protein